MSDPQPTEEELRAAYEAQLSQIRIEDVIIQNAVDLVNLGMRRTGLAPGTEGERDADQVRLAIEGVRAILPLIESILPEQVGQIRQALSQMQMAYVRIGGGPGTGASDAAPPAAATPADGPAGPPPGAGTPPGAGGPGAGAPPPPPSGPDPIKPGEAGPAQRSGRLWVPGMDR